MNQCITKTFLMHTDVSKWLNKITNEKEEINFPYRRIPFYSKRGEHNCSQKTVGKEQGWEGWVTFQWRSPTKDFTEVINVNNHSDKWCCQSVILIYVKNGTLLFPKPTTTVHHEKPLRQIPFGWQSTKCLTRTPQKLSRSRKIRRIWDIVTVNRNLRRHNI